MRMKIVKHLSVIHCQEDGVGFSHTVTIRSSAMFDAPMHQSHLMACKSLTEYPLPARMCGGQTDHKKQEDAEKCSSAKEQSFGFLFGHDISPISFG